MVKAGVESVTKQGIIMDDQKQRPPRPPTNEEIAALAYRFWEEEGQPADKAGEHGRRAEEELRDWHAPEPPEGEAGLPPMA